MFAFRRLAVALACVSSSVACAAPQATSSGHLLASRAPRYATASHPMLGAAIEIDEPARPETPMSAVVSLYEQGEPPTSSPATTAMYRQVCAEPKRLRERRAAYDKGDEIARRQDCYCADEMPCSENRDCTDLVVCYPQIALRDDAAPVGTRF